MPFMRLGERDATFEVGAFAGAVADGGGAGDLTGRRMRGSMRPGEERWPHWRPTFGARRKLVSTFEGHQWTGPSADAEKRKASAASSVPQSASRWAAWVSNPAPWD